MDGQCQTINLNIKDLKSFIQQAIQEAVSSEMAKLRIALFPFVSNKEQKDIERLYKKPQKNYSQTIQLEI